jgi:hypothetical protein
MWPGGTPRGYVPAHLPTFPVEQPIDLFHIRSTYRPFIHVCIMALWNGFEDGDTNSEHSVPFSPCPSPFSTAFRTPRPPGIETGVREVPRTLSEHAAKLYNLDNLCYDLRLLLTYLTTLLHLRNLPLRLRHLLPLLYNKAASSKRMILKLARFAVGLTRKQIKLASSWLLDMKSAVR